MGFQFELLTVTGNEGTTQLGFGDVSYQLDAFHVGHFFVVGDGTVNNNS